MNGNPNPAAPIKVAAAERQILALTLRKQGGSYRTIAKQLRGHEGISPRYGTADAHADVMAAFKKLAKLHTEVAEETRALELERLDDLHAVYWPRALKGDDAALDRVLNLMDRRAKYLDLYQDKGKALVDITVFIREVALEYGLDPDEAVTEAQKIVTRAR